ncbi:poly [ADP-ribose] polymerase 4-like, partial [Pelobates cultripes]
ARRALRDLILKKHLRSLRHSKGFFYAHANKGGKYLARLLKGTAPCTQIRKLCLASGTISPFPQEIAEEFKNYYQALYNLPAPGGNDRSLNRTTAMTNYLHNNVTEMVNPDSASALDAPISTEELAAALKNTKTWKSTGTRLLFHRILYEICRKAPAMAHKSSKCCGRR